MADNLSGDIDKAKSAWEGLILSFNQGSSVISKVGRGIVQSITNELQILTGVIGGVDKKISEELVIGFENFANVIKEVEGVETALSKTEELREGQLSKIATLESELETAGRKRSKAIEKELEQRKQIVAAQDEVIQGLQSEVKAVEDGKLAEIKAAEEALKVKAKLSSEEAKKADEEVQKNIARLERELEEKLALEQKYREQNSSEADALVDIEINR